MRLTVALGCLLLVGCTGPHSSGALWAQQDIEQETALFRLSDAQRADQAHAFELRLADETLAAERARIAASLQACPGDDRQPLAVSTGDRARDTVRLRAQDDPARMASLAQVALADWRLRRARATGDARFCDAARQALTGAVSSEARQVLAGGASSEAAAPDVLAELGEATVSRDLLNGTVADPAWPVSVALSSYAMGQVDTVQGKAPLPQYLAAVYGGELLGATTAPALDGAAPEALVDRFAPDYPAWEPDALYAAFVVERT